MEQRIRARIAIKISSNHTSEVKQIEMEVDQHMIQLGMTTRGCDTLEPWARQLFPKAEKVQVLSVVPLWH